MELIIFRNAQKIIALTEQGKDEIKKEFDIIFSGRIEKRKGSASLINICKHLISRKPDIAICILGYGDDYKEVVESLAPYNGKNILFTGQIPFDQVKSYYNKSKIYVSTSYYEGLPGTCIEAMCMELPAIVWDISYYAGLVIKNETGLYAPVNDISQMADNILALLSDDPLRIKMGENARETIKNEFNWEDISRKLINNYLRIE